MNFCSACGAPVALQMPPGDNRERYVCNRCEAIHYQNPTVVAGCIATHDDKILLCRRAIEPRYGLWTLPAGFMEMGESTRQAAERESFEEANAVIDDMALYCVYTVTHINQVHLMYRGRLQDGAASPGTESLETALVTENDIPWERLAFPIITEALQLFFSDRRQNSFPVHTGTILRKGEREIEILRDPLV